MDRYRLEGVSVVGDSVRITFRCVEPVVTVEADESPRLPTQVKSPSGPWTKS
jgi:hypothetical protein